jgi:arylsulfatase A-like enzyme
LLGIAQSYAGQVTMFDTCMGALLDFLDGLPTGQESLLTLQAARGFPLGEHLRVGPCDNALYGELVHVPSMMRLPDDAAAAVRSQALVEPADLWATLLDWWSVEGAPRSPTARSLLPIVRQQSEALRDRLCIAGNGPQRAIRTPAWHLRVGGEEAATGAEPELFAKPDDRWEVNNVATRCREVVDCLQDALAQYEQTLPAGQVSDLPPLADVLREGL